MRYVSTRGGGDAVDFRTALFSAYAPDGGLYVPECLPQIPWKSWRGLSYKQILVQLLPHFVPEDIDIKGTS